MTPAEILALPMRDNDAGADTVRGYLAELLRVLWREDEGFSGKRPFGNSGWQWEVYRALADGGAIESTRDRWGGDVDLDTRAADVLIDAAIVELGRPS